MRSTSRGRRRSSCSGGPERCFIEGPEIARFWRKLYETLHVKSTETSAFRYQVRGFDVVQAELLLTLEGQPLDPMRSRCACPTRAKAPLERATQRDSTGVCPVPELALAVGGEWEIELDVLIFDFERQTLKGVLRLE